MFPSTVPPGGKVAPPGGTVAPPDGTSCDGVVSAALGAGDVFCSGGNEPRPAPAPESATAGPRWRNAIKSKNKIKTTAPAYTGHGTDCRIWRNSTGGRWLGFGFAASATSGGA